MLYERIEEWRITERRNGQTYKTEYVRDWFLPCASPLPKLGGDKVFVATSDTKLYRKEEIPPSQLIG
jgi:hypothetical protein